MSPIFHRSIPTHHANLMMQYMVANKLKSYIPDIKLSNFDMTEWGIAHPPLPTHELGPHCDLGSEQHMDFNRIRYLADTGAFRVFNWRGYGQRMDNFPELDMCRSLFRRGGLTYKVFGDEYVVCPIRGAEVLTAVHPGYTIVPVDFYEEIIAASRLRPVFMGQIDDNCYTQELRRRFPDAIFMPSTGALSDFQTIRSAANIIISVSTFAWLAAWLSEAKSIVMPLYGIFDHKAFPFHDLVPFNDNRYKFYEFPNQAAVILDDLMESHRCISGQWSHVSPRQIVRF